MVRANNWIGDVVMISPALAALRRTYPDARIDVIARPQVADCFANHPSVNGVVVQDPRRHRGLVGTFRFAAELRQRDYDMAVLFQKAAGAALLARLAGIPRRVGYATDGRGILLTDRILETPASRAQHHVEYFLGVARGAGCDVNGARPRVVFPLDAASRAFADEFLAARDTARFAWLAAFAPGASKPGRAWHADRFAALAAMLARDHAAGIVVLGGPADRAEAAAILQAAGEAGIDAVAATTVRGMAALIERCRVFVGNDSGPMHVAAALDVPVLAMFGPGIPAKTAPWMPPERFVALSENFHCAPCRQDFFRECDPSPSLKPMCLETITTARAAAALESLLARTT